MLPNEMLVALLKFGLEILQAAPPHIPKKKKKSAESSISTLRLSGSSPY